MKPNIFSLLMLLVIILPIKNMSRNQNSISVHQDFDTVVISGLWTRVYYDNPNVKQIDHISRDYFILTDRFDTIKMSDVKKVVNLSNYEILVLNWNSHRSLFFCAFPDFPNSKELQNKTIDKINDPFVDCVPKKYKKNFYKICEYKLYAIRKVIPNKDFKRIFCFSYPLFCNP